MKKLSLIIFSFLALTVGITTTSWAGTEIDILVQKLVEKDILTPVEAQIILDETKQEVAKQVAQGKSSTLPKWVQSMKLKGDLRLRYQYNRKTSDDEARTRGRLRYRLGLESKIDDKTKVGFGIASGGDDPRSTNQTFQDTFETPDIRLDYAFAEHQFNESLKVVGGKFKRKPYLWAPTDLLWDGDITPYGAAASYSDMLVDNIDYWVNGGVLVLDESKNVDRGWPIIKYIQAGLTYKEGAVDGKVALNYYSPHGVSGRTFTEHGAGSNTGASTGLLSSYTAIGTSTEVGYKEMFGGLPFDIDQRIALFTDFIHNLDDDNIKDNMTGWAFGFKLGNKKVKKPGNWQMKYTKAKLGKDAWLDFLPDSDRFGGATGIESHEVALKYALKKNVIFGLDYYKTWDQSDRSDKEHLIQADLLFKF